MRQNFERITYTICHTDIISQCRDNVRIPYPLPTVLRYKRGSSGSSPVRADGSRAPNPCDIEHGVTSYVPMRKRFTFKCGYHCEMVGQTQECVDLFETSLDDIGTPLYAAGAYVPNAVNQQTIDEAVTRWYAKLADFRANIAADLATYRQTVDMVSGLTARVAEAAKQLRRRNLHGLADALGIARPGELRENFGSAWLQLQYGWKPLLGDIHELLTYQGASALRTAVRIRHRATGTYTGHGPYDPIYDVRASYTDIVTVNAMVKLNNQRRMTVSQMGLDDPLLLAWELLPYSFVVDWFVPIGPYLESQTASGLFEVTDFSVTSTRYIDGDVSLIPPAYYGEHIAGKLKITGSRKVRTTAQPSLPLPSFDIPFNSGLTRYANALALLSNAISGRGRF